MHMRLIISSLLAGIKRTPLFSLLISALCLTSLGITPVSAADELKTPRKILTGWIPYYSMKTSLPSALNNLDLIQEVMPFWYTLKYNGAQKKMYVSDLYTPANPSVPISTPLSSMRSAGLKIIPTITDGTDKLVLAKEISTAANRTRLAADITSFVTNNNFDGIDLDFENFAFLDGNTTWSATQPNWVAFIKELSAQLHAQKRLLSVTSPVVFFPTDKQKGYTVYAWSQIATYIDRLRIMAYDYSLANPGPIGPLAWTERAIQYATSVIPASKVFVGVPGYGRDWVTKVDGVCPANIATTIKVGAKAAAFVLRDALTLAQTYGATPSFNETFGETTFTYQKVYNGQTAAGLATSCTATRTVWYHDVRSFTARAQFVGKYRLGGIAEWTLGMEDQATSQAIREVARSIAPDKVIAALNVNKTELGFGEITTLSGQFTLPDKSPVANLKVYVEMLGSDEKWKQIYQTVTASDGTVSIPLLLGKSSQVHLYSEGSWERAESFSSDISINIYRKISIKAPSIIARGSNITVNGVLYPRTSGVSVQLQSANLLVTKSIASSVTDAQGNFTFTIPTTMRGLLTYQVTAPADAQWAQITSAPFTVLVR